MARAFPPAEFIRDELEARGATVDELSKLTGWTIEFTNLIVDNQQGITPEIAEKLAAVFHTSSDFWLNLEGAYSEHRNLP